MSYPVLTASLEPLRPRVIAGGMLPDHPAVLAVEDRGMHALIESAGDGLGALSALVAACWPAVHEPGVPILRPTLNN